MKKNNSFLSAAVGAGLAVDLGCKVLCEGVETQEQHRFVLEAGCHYGQGFLFYRPLEADQFVYLMGGKNRV